MDEKKRLEFILQHRLFWVGLVAIVIILPLFGIIEFDVPLSTGKAVQTISYQKAGAALHFEIRNIDGLKDLTVTFSQDVKNVVIKIDEIKNLGWPFDGTAYVKFRISSDDAPKISELKFTLKINKDSLAKLGLSKEALFLYLDRQALETEFTKEEGDYYYFTATSFKSGEFLIGLAKPEVIEEIPEASETPLPSAPLSLPEEAPLPPEAPLPSGPIAEIPPAEEQPLPLPEEKGFFSKIFSSLKKLFSKEDYPIYSQKTTYQKE